MEKIIAAFILSLSANLDTFSLSVSYGIKKIRIPFFSNILISLLTTLGTFLSMEFGFFIRNLIPSWIANALGGISMMGIGIWFLIDYFRNSCKDEIPMVDSDHSGDISLKETIPLIIALTINNIGVGISGSMSGVSILYTSIFTFIITYLCIQIGTWAGKTIVGKVFGKYTTLVSNIFLILFGLYEIFF